MSIALLGTGLDALHTLLEQAGVRAEVTASIALKPPPEAVVIRVGPLPMGSVPSRAMLYCQEHLIPVALVFDELTPDVVRTILSIDGDIWWITSIDRLGEFPINELKNLLEARSRPGHGFVIGSERPMPSDPEEYENSRGLSMVSYRMSGFVRALRNALQAMRRPAPQLPWDPADAQAPRILDTGMPEGTPAGKASAGSRARHSTNSLPNLRDVIGGSRYPWVVDYLEPRDPHVIAGWQQLPPPLLVLGSSGTGKSLVARMVHEQLWGPGLGHPLESVSCTSIQTDNFSYLMHGAAAGAFTGIAHGHVGILARAAYGTLFLDEVGDMPVETQVRLLTFFNDQMISPQGGRPFRGYMQIVAATNRDLENRVAVNAFRHDFLERFGNRVRLPDLKDRGPAELRQMIDFVAQDPRANPIVPTTDGNRRAVSHIADDAMEHLMGLDYADGNFRELEQIVGRGIRRARERGSSVLLIEHLRGVRSGKPNYRGDHDERVIRVHSIDQLEATAHITVESSDELRRLAELRDTVILRDEAGREAVLDRGARYAAPDSGVEPASRTES